VVLKEYFNKHLLTNLSIDEMINISSKPGLIPKIKFGKHRDELFKNLPKGYLKWLTQQSGMDANVKYTAEHWLS